MKQYFINLYARFAPYVIAYAKKVYAWSPFAIGIAIGYFGHPIFAAAVSLIAGLLHL